jgi:hypothetical protein
VDFGKPATEAEVRDTVAAILKLGVDVNATNPAGDTALHVAAGAGQNSIVQLLAEAGANVNAKNQRGVTPLAAALSGGGGRGGRRGGAAGAAAGAAGAAGAGTAAAAAGAGVAAAAAAGGDDDTGIRRAPVSHQSTAALLRKLGATE